MDLISNIDGTGITWDDNGNMAAGLTSSLTWNWDNRLRAASVGGSSVGLKYDPDGNRIYKESNDGQTNTKRKYIIGEAGGLPVILLEIDHDNNNEIVKSYVYAQDDLVAQYNGPQDSGDKYFYICDRLGNVRQVIDVNASVQYLYTYGPFGKVLESDEDADPPGNAFQFTGQFYDADLDQYYLRARQYSPDLARFTARDPYPGQFQEPATLHTYLYCLDDPINLTDPTGEFSYLQATVTAAKYGLMAWSAYSTYQTVKGYAQQIASGVAIRSVLIDVCIDVSLSWGAGKALGFITKVGAPLISRVGQKIAKKGGKKIAKKAKDPSHHFATNKNQTYTPQMEEITEKYGLDLDSDWNIEDISKLYHRGRHPKEYHEFVLDRMKKADAEAAGDVDKFLELFDEYIIDPVMENPEVLQKDGW